MCDVLKHSYQLGMISTRDGNASIRDQDRNYFYITPSGVRKQLLQYTMFKKLNIDTKDNLRYTPESEGLTPSGELPLHWGLQKNITTETRVVLHLHPTYTVAAMYKGIELSDLVEQFPELSRYSRVGKNVPEVPPISQDLADYCHKNLELSKAGSINYDIVGIKNHGVVAIDETPWRAFEHIERLEHICKIVLAAS